MATVPKEIRDHILKDVYDICRLENRPTIAYASVCPKWQGFFEAKHFAKLNVTLPRLADFDRIVVGERRELVRHIRADIALCRGSPWQYNEETYIYVISKLLASLSTWDMAIVEDPDRLVLEISTSYTSVFAAHHNPSLLAVPSPTPQRSLSRITEVKAVTTLLLHRNTYNMFQLHPRALHHLLRSLPALKSIIYHNRVTNEPHEEAEPSIVYELMLQSLPASVDELRLFEDGRDGFSPAHSMLGFQVGPNSLRVDSLSLGLCMARASRQLQHLSASFVVDARHFFQPFWPQPSTARTANTKGWVWSRLETMALTSQLLFSPHESEEDINYLLEATSRAVRRMPKLHTLEIWNGNGDEHACLFRYSYDPGSRRASLTWKGTWAIDITQRTKDSWSETVRQKTGLGGAIRIEKMTIHRPFMVEAAAIFLDLQMRVITERGYIFAKRLFSIGKLKL